MKSIFTVHLEHLEDTKRLGLILSKILKPGDVIGLKGVMGAGKTTLVQSIAKGLDIQEEVQSPTFNLFRMHQSGRIPLWHFDCYRLEGHSSDLGFEEYIGEDAIAVIEWPEFFPGRLPNNLISMTIEIGEHQTRIITISTSNAAWLESLRSLWQ
jgi:tRNA threonylcarbamoyladenosine biosynthesis protein TsaE